MINNGGHRSCSSSSSSTALLFASQRNNLRSSSEGKDEFQIDEMLRFDVASSIRRFSETGPTEKGKLPLNRKLK